MGTQKSYTVITHHYDDGEGNDFEVPYSFSDYHEVHLKIIGNTATLGVLVQDGCPSNPMEDYDEGELVSFGYMGRDRPDSDDFKTLVRANPGRVIMVYARDRDTGYFADDVALDIHHTKGENCYAEEVAEADGYYISPKDVTDPLSYAKGTMETYSSYCVGDVWGICIWEYRKVDGEWELLDEERAECWGYFGEEYAEEELKSEFERY